LSLFGNVIIETVFSALIGNSTLMGLVNNSIYDHVPDKEGFPFIAIGELIQTEANTGSPEQQVEASLTLHSYSRYDGRDQTHQIQEEINKTLHRANLVSSGVQFISVDHVQSQSFVDADGITRHGVMEFKILITEI